MSSLGKISVDSLPGNLRLKIEGSDPSHPWLVVLTPEATGILIAELVRVSSQMGFNLQIPASVTSGASGVRRPPSLIPNRVEGSAPKSSVEPVSSEAVKQRKSSAEPLGDTF